ncbi:LysE family translocator [Jannaschia seohaensis]|uniref:Threonine/homoserine/homoserine lactone efflux protein n=1 Tax=Jannaschia seohaensis TaxID=475081 RepID=A0A2Y9B1Q5_9RHOB|nr:LysE family translocator [Jannaschia seohaensis]PWJ13843.1 threonine/homoserine/homoserine lactone efflux protein [Jannaschia seohaensis]SSA50356.1 Threonine/homoserine/homoserine lactone efflux protein [Jannaschia seohaensis]
MIEGMTPFFAYVIALGIAAVIPGPGVAAVVGRAMGTGTRASLPFVLGLAFGDVLFLSIAILGLSAVAAAATGVFFVIKIAGGLYLLYLAWGFWTAEATQPDAAEIATKGGWRAAASGLAVTLGNPKTVVFYLALVPNVIDMEAVGVLDWLFLSMLTICTLVAVLMPYAIMASRLRAILVSPTALRKLNRGAAVMIGGAGALILSDAVAE